MADVDKNSPVWLRTDDQPLRVTGVAPIDPDQPDRIVLTTAPAPAHALKRWELIMLTHDPAMRRRMVYAQQGDQTVPVFGFAFADHAIVLH